MLDLSGKGTASAELCGSLEEKDGSAGHERTGLEGGGRVTSLVTITGAASFLFSALLRLNLKPPSDSSVLALLAVAGCSARFCEARVERLVGGGSALMANATDLRLVDGISVADGSKKSESANEEGGGWRRVGGEGSQARRGGLRASAASSAW